MVHYPRTHACGPCLFRLHLNATNRQGYRSREYHVMWCEYTYHSCEWCNGTHTVPFDLHKIETRYGVRYG